MAQQRDGEKNKKMEEVEEGAALRGPVYDPNSFKVNSNPLILCRVRVGLSGRVKIASPNKMCLYSCWYNFQYGMNVTFFNILHAPTITTKTKRPFLESRFDA